MPKGVAREFKEIAKWLVYGALGLTGLNAVFNIFQVSVPMFSFLVTLVAFCAIIMHMYASNGLKFKNKLDLMYFGILMLIVGIIVGGASFIGITGIVQNIMILNALYMAFIPMATGIVVGGVIVFLVGTTRIK